MRLLANENFPIPSVLLLENLGFDISSILLLRPGISDADVLQWAVKEERCILTFDRDYGELIFARKLATPPAIIFLRLQTYRPEQPGEIVQRLFQSAIAVKGHFITIEEDGIRRRLLPE